MSRKIEQIYLLLTEKCNLNCKHCLRGEKKDDFIPLEDLEIIAFKIKSYSEDISLVISGGEPTIHPHFLEIIDFLSDSFNKLLINTNGISPIIVDNYRLFLKKNITIQISLDGTESTHDAIRGKNTFTQSYNNLLKLIEKGVKVTVSTVLTDKNYDSLFYLYDMLKEAGISLWKVSPYLPFQTDVKMKQIFPTEWNQFVDDIALKEVPSLKIVVHKLFDINTVSQLSDEQIRSFAKYAKPNCGSGVYKIYIYPDLTVYGCSCLKNYPFGNLSNEGMSIDTILMSDNAQLIRNYEARDKKCQSCRYIPICNGGCIGYSLYQYNELGRKDIRCPL